MYFWKDSGFLPKCLLWKGQKTDLPLITTIIAKNILQLNIIISWYWCPAPHPITVKVLENTENPSSSGVTKNILHLFSWSARVFPKCKILLCMDKWYSDGTPTFITCHYRKAKERLSTWNLNTSKVSSIHDSNGLGHKWCLNRAGCFFPDGSDAPHFQTDTSVALTLNSMCTCKLSRSSFYVL